MLVRFPTLYIMYTDDTATKLQQEVVVNKKLHWFER